MRRRPVRSLQIPLGSRICPTDFTDIHRFFIGVFCHADFADDADFYSSDDTEFIRRFPAEAITHGFSQRRPVRSLQIPPEIGQRDSIKKSVEICEICGTKTFTKKNLRHLRNLRDKTNSSTFRAPAIGQRPNIRENP